MITPRRQSPEMPASNQDELRDPLHRRAASGDAGADPMDRRTRRPQTGEEHAARLDAPVKPFVWGVGIESSTLPHLDVDQFEWTQHNRCWREDLSLVSQELGLHHLRYAVPWHYLEPERGRYDWRVVDERLEACRDLGLEVMLDVMHFGTPKWLGQAVGDPEFPEALEALTAAMVERYRGFIRTWCPVNEPLVTALFSGDFGFWPPHSRKWRGYMPVLARIAIATARSIRAIRRLQPEAQVLICDAADHFKTREPALQAEVNLRNLRRFLLLDLVTGQVDHRHPLYEWVCAYGISELDLDWLASHRQQPDIIGLDYYPHSDWLLESGPCGLRQRRADSPAGLYGIAQDYYNRFGLPMLVTETSIEGKPINREVWLQRLVDDAAELRSAGVPLMGLIWWPLVDHLDWDGALTHRVGKLHQVGLYKLVRQEDGALQRTSTPLADIYRKLAGQGDEAVGTLMTIAEPVAAAQEQLPPLAQMIDPALDSAAGLLPSAEGTAPRVGGGGSGNGGARSAPITATATLDLESPAQTCPPQPIAGDAATDVVTATSAAPAETPTRRQQRATGSYGIVVFSHLRWGFVWQRPQQFLSRFARRHPILFIEEPMFDQAEGTEPRLELHQVMPNVTVACAHCPPDYAQRQDLPENLRNWAREAIDRLNDTGAFERPLLWYYSPMDAAWSLGAIENRGIVYDCMDELSQFSGAPPQLIAQENRLLQVADTVFTGGYKLWTRKREQHDNAHFFGCGVEVEHFNLAMDPATTIPPDIDFMARPIIGWFGVIDERVDYHLVGEMAKLRPDWSFAMVGPVVKVDPNLLPCAPNLFWLGSRDYTQLPNYCRAFDVCMMCFAINDATEYINPTKALEYLATGRPVVATPVSDVVRQYTDLMDIAQSPEQFVTAIERNLREPDQERIARGLAKARESSWEATVAQMQAIIAESIEVDARRSARRIAPLSAVELKYQFQRTPGS